MGTGPEGHSQGLVTHGDRFRGLFTGAGIPQEDGWTESGPKEPSLAERPKEPSLVDLQCIGKSRDVMERQAFYEQNIRRKWYGQH